MKTEETASRENPLFNYLGYRVGPSGENSVTNLTTPSDNESSVRGYQPILDLARNGVNPLKSSTNSGLDQLNEFHSRRDL